MTEHTSPAPCPTTEERLTAIWKDVLECGEIGPQDDFFELGGDSIYAGQVIVRIGKEFGKTPSIDLLFRKPTVAGLAEWVGSNGKLEASHFSQFERVTRPERLPLSYAQQRLWFLSQFEGASAAYHVNRGLRLKGRLDRAALGRALDRIVARHEILRTTFVTVDGEPVQRIAPAEESRFQFIAEEAGFDLENGPLIRGRLIRESSEQHTLLISMHHIVSDGWSMGVFIRELSALYGAFARGEEDPLPALEVQYADYAVWQRKWMEGGVLRQQGEYWKRTLAGAPVLLELPTDHARPVVQHEHAGGWIAVALDEELTRGLKELGRKHGATLHMILLAAWGALLGRLAGQEDVVIGTPVANRGRVEIEGLIGFFVNTLALRLDLSGSPNAGELLQRVKERTLAAQQHQDIPFEQVVEIARPVRSLAHTPLFQVMFAWQNAHEGRPELPGVEAERLDAAAHVVAKFDLTLSLQEADGRITGGLEYAATLFEQSTVERYVGYLRTLLAAMVAEETQAIDRLPLLPDAELQQVVSEWNATEAEYPRGQCVHELFEQQVKKTPDAVAVVFEDTTLSYGELNRRANQLAHDLQELGVGPEARVGICLERGLERIIGLLGIVKAGGAYVPLDPAYPAERLEYLVADSAPVAVLTERRLRSRIGPHAVVLEMDGWRARDVDRSETGVTAGHLAYVIYTSGSTGTPRGVAIEHGSLANLVHWHAEAFGLEAGQRTSSVAGFGFDAAAWEIWPALCTGCVLLLAPRGAGDVEQLLDWWLKQDLDVSFLPTPLAEVVFTRGDGPGGLRTLLIGGDRLHQAPPETLGYRVVNNYGPTETTVVATSGARDGAEAVLTIGRPIANTQVYILDAQGAPAPVGVNGELYIGGAALGRGYLGRAELTAERFMPDPFGGQRGARMYRTGDVGRWRADGTIEFVGRNDFQVKIRGYRIELGEIEARLVEHEGVREAVVLAREDQRLVAYYTGAEIGADGLRMHLASKLPEYMAPSAYVWLERLPLTPNGKVDRKALPEPACGVRGYEAPEGEIETALASIWAELLKLERVGRQDSFFELGGHSLLAMRVLARLRKALNVEVTIGDLFAHPVLADLARSIGKAAQAVLPPITHARRGEQIPLSFAQQRLWFLAQMEGVSAAYHIRRGVRLKGRLDRAALGRALDRIVARHEILRTTFVTVDGEPVQRIAPAEQSRFELLADLDVGFDLENGPLIRGRLIRESSEEHTLLISMHHIVSDGWSIDLFLKELSALYGAFVRGEEDPLPELEVQYADYAVWQRKWMEGEVLRQQAEYWERALAGAPALLELPTDHPRPSTQDYAGGWAHVVLDEELTRGLKELSKRHGATLYMTLLAAWAALLGRLAGQEDVVIGTPVANRGRVEIEGLIGFFVNTLALRVDLAGSPNVGQLLQRVKERTLAAQQHQDIPFEQVVEIARPARSLAHSPLFQVMFAWQNAHEGRVELPGLDAELLGSMEHRTAKFDLTLSLRESDQQVLGGLEYATSLFEQSTIERYIGYLHVLLKALVAEDTQPVDRLPLLPDAERQQVVYGWNATAAEYPREQCVHELFEQQVEQTPDAVAVAYEDTTLSYRELNRRANQLAHYLREKGVGPDARVAICVERSLEMIVGPLAILKAGGAYVPLDPEYPPERLHYMLADSAPAVLLTGRHIAERFDRLNQIIHVIDLTDAAPHWTLRPDTNPDRAAVGLGPQHLAYMIYTSGSTGLSKGVMVTHGSVVNLFFGLRSSVYGSAKAGCLRVSVNGPLAFDTSVKQMVQLLDGHALDIVPEALRRDGAAMVRFLRDRNIQVLDCTPSQLHLLLDAGVPLETAGSLQLVLVGGEPIDETTWETLAGSQIQFFNVYGPTECTVDASVCAVRPGAGPSIGRPIANTTLYVLDSALNPVPCGAPGELYIGGDCVARGYWKDPESTALKFIGDPFRAGARLYRSGDVGRRLPDGTTEYIGRNDFQVKVRGYRIELGEIEARLAEHEGVREAVVIAREDQRLVAYYTGAEIGAEALRMHLASKLPEYMAPAAYVRLERLPLTPNGKVDRKALPEPDYGVRGYEAPVGEIETALAGIWAELLKLNRVGRQDNFFELGGHSLLAMRVLARLRKSLNIEVTIGDLFAHPVLADLAGGIGKAAQAALPPITLAPRGEQIPLSFAQQRLWFLAQIEGVRAAYQISYGLRLRGALDRAALGRALDRIVARHEILRTTFVTVDGEPVQRIAPAEGSRFQFIAEEAGFDLENGPLIRGRLIRESSEQHTLLISMHHIVSDGWSMGVFIRELSALYGAYVRGEEDPLPELEVQYADYAVWQRRWMEGEVLRQQGEYWERTLAGAPALLELPTDHARPVVQHEHAGGWIAVSLDEELTRGLKELGRKRGATLHMILLAAWGALLGRLAGQNDVVIGTPVANRGRVEIEGLIGFFVNTLALRLDLSGSPNAGELLQRVKERTLAAQQHQDIPFEQVVEIARPSRSLAHSPLFQVMFAWQNAHEGRPELPGVEAERLDAAAHVVAKFDLTLSLQESDGRIAGGLEYAATLFGQSTVERYVGYLRTLLAAMVAEETQAIDRLPLLPDAELQQVVSEWNATEAEYPRDQCVHELFEQQVEKTPDAVAVVFEDTTLSYGELNRRANQLAQDLRALGAGPDARVAICLERGLERIIGLLGIVKAGGAYVPLDPAYPAERLEYMLSDSAPVAVLTERRLRSHIGLHPVVLEMDGWRATDANRGETGVTAGHLAYVIYTSGSTGTPRGVAIEHGSLANLVHWHTQAFGLEAGQRTSSVAGFGFDAAAWEIWPALCTGCVVLLAPRAAGDVEQLLDWWSKQNLDISFLPTPLAEVVFTRGNGPAGLRTLLIGGDRLHQTPPETLGYRVVNNYGPTETTVVATSGARDGAGAVLTIGRPIANTQVYILDAQGAPAPVGVNGELYIGGAALGRGYLGRAELTAERFMPDTFSGRPGARMYRTGDVGRWRADGTIEFVGRNDFQVKIRGYRIELGEIEARLVEHDGVREAVVIAREDQRLVAYYTGAEIGADGLRMHLASKLPEYMAPSAYVRLEQLPLTPNGKVDRKALPEPACGVRGYEAPVGQIETALASIWAELLKLERVGRQDSFFELGGHSLLAMRVLARLRKALNVEVTIGDLFAHPVLADLARSIGKAAQAALPPIMHAPRGEQIPLSFAQQRLWFLAQMEGVSQAYHIRRGVRLKGRLDRAALGRALDRIVARHEILRTTFVTVDGEPVQRIAPAEQSRFELLAEEAGFDLENGPLIRGRLIEESSEEYTLLISMHHIVSDGWSIDLFLKELSALYGAFVRGEEDPLPELEVQYADYAVWQRRWMEGEVLRQQGEYWERTLAGAPVLLELPTDHARPSTQDYAGGWAHVVLDEELTRGLKELSKRHGATLYMTLLAAWAALLGRLSGQEDMVIGTPVANRGRVEIEGLIGFFVNTLALRVDLAGSPNVGQLLQRVKERTLAAQQHQDIPFEQVVEIARPARSLAHSPLFQVMFAWQNAQEGRVELPGLDAELLGSMEHRTAKFDLTLSLRESDQQVLGGVEYATSLFEQSTIERYIGYLHVLLKALAAEDTQPVDRLPLLPDAELQQVVYGWNATAAEYPREQCVHELFEQQVEQTPDAVAAVFEDTTLSYGELNRRANQLAHYLRELGVGPDARVAICVERSLEMIVGPLAILKAGGAYVPLDPAYPAERLEYMLADSAPAVLLTQVDLEAAAPPWRDQPQTNPDRVLRPEHSAYVIYTSGSTGQPKGVIISHAALTNLFVHMRQEPGIGPDDVVLATTTLSFDIATLELYLPLTVGAHVRIASREVKLDGVQLQKELQREITILQLTPTGWQMLIETGWQGTSGLKALCGGEALSRELAGKLISRSHSAWNMYAPTETTIYSVVEKLGEVGSRVVIGRPIANTRIYILDRHGEPAAVGVAGELYIAGTGLARGYLNRGDLTAERFVSDPFARERGARMYKTGDLARWRPDGTIEYIGRNDFQVKVRGYRIELGEIEARLAEHDGVREAVVMAWEDQRLVAYYTGAELGAEALRAHLTARLPAYMIPAAYIHMERLPLTPNRKVDRRALPAPAADAYGARGYVAPLGEIETALASIWAELLKLERVGRHENFFELGGHSLLAVRVISRLRNTLNVEVTIGDLFAHPVLADLARNIGKAAAVTLPPLTPAARREQIPLSFAQQRLWFLAQMEGVSEAYHISYGLRLKGLLDRAALGRALDRIVARHEILRTTFAAVDGEPVQRIAPAEESRFQLQEHGPGGFDLENGPLIRGRLIEESSDEHTLLVSMHHIVSDGWSIGVFLRELSALYGAFVRDEEDPLPELEIQYADYAVWQRQWMEGEVLRQQGEYWERTLAGAPALLELPTDHPRPATQDYAGGRAAVLLDEELTRGLKELSKRHGTTLYMTLLAAWAALLGRLSGQEDIVIGTPVANRGRVEIEGLIGFFVNTLALRLDLAGSPNAGQLLQRVKERTLAGQQHQDIPFEQVVEMARPVRSLAHSPLFQVMFMWQQNIGGGALELPGLEVKPSGSAARVTSKFDLTLALREADERIVGGLEYATALFEQSTIERYLEYLHVLLKAMVAEDTQPIDRLPLLPEAELQRVVYEWNATVAEYPRECVHELFEQQVEKTPDTMAVAYEDTTLSYGELNRRANQLAHYLRELGVGPDARVAICIERGLEMLVGLLAVLKAGGAYVPLDPAYPAERLTDMALDSDPLAVLTGGGFERLSSRIAGSSPVLDLEAAAPPWQAHPETNPRPARIGLTPENLAYVIYTSGSTGRPKGVMIPHSGLTNFLVSMQREPGIRRDDVVLATTTISFDIAALELYLPLTVGAHLRIASREARLDGRLVEQESQRGVTIMQSTPTSWQMLVDAGWQGANGLKALCGGEALSLELARKLVDRSQPVWNMYGPTETTVWSLVEKLSHFEDRVTVGRPIANTRVYIVDRRENPLPIGVAGEVCIAGAGVARGYLNRGEVTAERFAPDPYSGQAGARMYKTGDLGRWLPDGSIEFLGRNDFQVKVRGYRIELGEIEARLAEHAGVREAVVMAREDQRLVAYYTGAEIGAEPLRAHLASKLPEYMVPAAYVRLERLPLTPNGKVDRKALPAPEADAYGVRGYEAPLGEIETALAELWAELLKLDRVGRRDHFFELGGHSLLAVRVIARLRKTINVEVSIGDVFAHPDLAGLARAIENAGAVTLPPVTPAARGERIPLSFAQQRLWFLSQMEGVSQAYQLFQGWRLKGPLDRQALRQALDRIVARHEPLRTIFVAVEGQPEQRIAPPDESWFHLLEHNLGEAPELERLVRDELATGFDLERGPLIRGHLIEESEHEYALLITMHHIVSDGWSMGVFLKELTSLYAAFARGREDRLPELAVQYADYAVWQRKWMDGEILRIEGEYWERTLAGAPALLELPTDHPRPAEQDYSGGWVKVALDEELTRGLKELSKRRGTTLYMTLAAGWAALLARLSGQEDIIIGTPVANRERAEIEELIGVFVNLLALRLDVSGSPSVGELLDRVKRQTLDAQQHKDIPFEQVLEIARPARSPAHSPLFQVGFDWQHAAEGRLALHGLEIGPLRLPLRDVAKFDLRLWLGEVGERIVGGLEYATALFEQSTVERYVGYLRALLGQMVAEETQPVDRLPLLPETERQRALAEWNAAESPCEQCVHELFEQQVDNAPDAVAVIFEESALSYGELNRRANQLAHYLQTLGVGPDARVGICVERGLEMVVALLAVWKAGGAYVPLDPAYPAERLRYMVADSQPAAVLTHGHLRDLFTANEGPPALDLGAVAPPWSEQAESNPETALVGLKPAHLAYVIYTSGSTGLAKGVMVEHRQLANYVAAIASKLGVEEGWAYGFISTFAADLGNTVLIPSLLRKGRLHVLPLEAATDGERFGRYCRERGIDCVKITPTHFQALLGDAGQRERIPARRLVLGGETLSRELIAKVEALRPECRIFNHYGPTECTVGALSQEMNAASKAAVALGRPLANLKVYVLDRQGTLQPAGVVGEIHIGGAGVTRGYLDRAGLTAERFVPDPFSDTCGARMYKTGDLGRWLADGAIEFLGRNDLQVKVRGYRIELGEIEARLAEHQAVREAVVVAREDTPGDRRLVAYYTGEQDNGVEIGPEQLRAHLAELLPEYMAPSAYVRMEKLPLTPNGKVDRKALPGPEADAYGARGYQEPVGEIERALAEIWEELLRVERVGRRDNFFELGGHSLLAVGVIMRLQQTLNVEVTIGDLFECPVLAPLAERLLNLQLAQFDADTLADLVNLMRGSCAD